jgi:hypothetical protein
MARSRRPIFVLDEGFPQPILREALRIHVPELDVRLVQAFEPRFVQEDTPDHRLIQGLWQRGAEGLVTVDDSMLDLPEVVMMIEQTRFSVVSVTRLGHDGVAASGLFLAHIGRIARRHNSGIPQVWRLSAPERQPVHTRELANSIRSRSGVDCRDYKLSFADLRQPVLAP